MQKQVEGWKDKSQFQVCTVTCLNCQKVLTTIKHKRASKISIQSISKFTERDFQNWP